MLRLYFLEGEEGIEAVIKKTLEVGIVYCIRQTWIGSSYDGRRHFEFQSVPRWWGLAAGVNGGGEAAQAGCALKISSTSRSRVCIATRSRFLRLSAFLVLSRARTVGLNQD